MQNKLMTAADAICTFVHDGDCIAFGGFSTNRRASVGAARSSRVFLSRFSISSVGSISILTVG